MTARPYPSRSARTLAAFALAYAGGVIGYLPLLTLLLPIKVEAIAGDARIGILTAATLAGAVAASLSNILFGWWSDRVVARGGGRRRFVAAGLAATTASYAAIGAAATPVAIVAAVAAFQIALNIMLAPMMAAMADEIPDDRKGLAGGLLALANPLAAAVSAIVTGAALLGETGLGETGRFAAIVAAMGACVLPLLLTRARPAAAPDAAIDAPAARRRDLLLAWVARLLVQLAGGVLFHYLLYYFESMPGAAPPLALAASLGQLLTAAYILTLPVALLLGRVSDRAGRPRAVLFAAATIAATGLAVMAGASGWTGAVAGFAAYTVGSSAFLALHATYAMRLLPSTARRGRDLGLLNLTNTLPSILGPALAWGLADPGDFTMLMLALAALTAIGGGAMLGVRRPD